MTASERIRAARMMGESNEGEERGTMEAETYNGWKNYPTWAVNLWLGNERALYEETRERAQQALESAARDENTTSGIWSEQETARYRLADDLKTWVTDELAPDLGASFASDLLGYALGEVDWDEIAASWIESELEDRDGVTL